MERVLKKIGYSLRRLWIDIIYGFVTWFIIGVVAYRLRNRPDLNFIIYVIILAASYIFLAIIKDREKAFFYVPFDNQKNKFDWMGNGTFEYLRGQKCFRLGHCDPGYLYAKCLTWSHYKLEFDFKILTQAIGCIIRAVNLSNYLMLQITKAGIRPHIRINGAWKVWEAADVGLDFEEKLDLGVWYHCRITCEDNLTMIKISDNKTTRFDRKWSLPERVILFLFKKNEQDQNPINIPFSINLEYGTVGFRNSGDEDALIKNFLVEKI